MILLLAMIFLGVGSIGVLTATILEMKYHEPIYKLMIKIFPWLFGAGGVLLGLHFALS